MEFNIDFSELTFGRFFSSGEMQTLIGYSGTVPQASTSCSSSIFSHLTARLATKKRIS